MPLFCDNRACKILPIGTDRWLLCDDCGIRLGAHNGEHPHALQRSGCKGFKSSWDVRGINLMEICTCGHEAGQHVAKYPHDCCGNDDFCDCPKFASSGAKRGFRVDFCANCGLNWSEHKQAQDEEVSNPCTNFVSEVLKHA